jgi:hypothetical protein
MITRDSLQHNTKRTDGVTASVCLRESLAKSASEPIALVREEILFEQLEYLIQYADQESDRLKRVTAVLIEAFSENSMRTRAGV